MFIKPEPHQLISNTEMMKGRICYDWLVSHPSLWHWICIFHVRQYPVIIIPMSHSFLSLPNAQTFLYLVWHHACLPSRHILPLLFWVLAFQFPLDSDLGELLMLVADFFKLFSCSSYFLRHGHFKHIHHPCLSQYLGKDIDACFVRLHLRQVPASNAHIAYLTMLTPFSAMHLF